MRCLSEQATITLTDPTVTLSPKACVSPQNRDISSWRRAVHERKNRTNKKVEGVARSENTVTFYSLSNEKPRWRTSRDTAEISATMRPDDGLPQSTAHFTTTTSRFHNPKPLPDQNTNFSPFQHQKMRNYLGLQTEQTTKKVRNYRALKDSLKLTVRQNSLTQNQKREA